MPLAIDCGVTQSQARPRFGDEGVKQEHFLLLMPLTMLKRQTSVRQIPSLDIAEQAVIRSIFRKAALRKSPHKQVRYVQMTHLLDVKNPYTAVRIEGRGDRLAAQKVTQFSRKFVQIESRNRSLGATLIEFSIHFSGGTHDPLQQIPIVGIHRFQS